MKKKGDSSRYISSMVLGINDALIELTGVLAGFTLAFQNTSIISVAGLITGIAASLSMAGSEYLSIKSESGPKSPYKAALRTGLSYFFTVLVLIFPFLILENAFKALAFTIFNAIIIIFLFTYYLSKVKKIPFKKRFIEMLVISMGIATITFGLGYLVKTMLG